MPQPIVDKINREAGKALKSADVRERFAQWGLEVEGGTPGDFAAAIKADADRGQCSGEGERAAGAVKRGGRCAATVTFTSSAPRIAIRRCRSAPIWPALRRVETLKRLGARARHRPLRDRAAELLRRRQFGDARCARCARRQRPRRRGDRSGGDVAPDTLADFHRRGVRGLRINLYSPIKAPGGDTLEAAFAATAEAARDDGLACAGDRAAAGAARQRRSCWRKAPVPVVIDHYGLYGDKRPGQRRRPPPARSRAPAACLDEAVRAVSSRSRPAEHQAGPRMARGADRGRAGSLRLGQRLAASAGARAAEGRVGRSAVSRAVLRDAGRRISSPRCRPPILPSGSWATTRRGFTAFSRWTARDRAADNRRGRKQENVHSLPPHARGAARCSLPPSRPPRRPSRAAPSTSSSPMRRAAPATSSRA